MASKKKLDGNQTIQHVAAVIRSCDCDETTFFARAASVAKQRNVSFQGAVENFRTALSRGIRAVPKFEIPDYVVRLADLISQRPGDPRVFFRSL